MGFRLALPGSRSARGSKYAACLPGVAVGVRFVEIFPEAARAIEHERKCAEARRAGILRPACGTGDTCHPRSGCC